MKDTKFAVLIPTYQRSDNRTPAYLRRALQSVFDQTYQNFMIFVVGDKYEDDQEFETILKEFDVSRIIYVNLYYAKERDKYSDNLQVLWNTGGVNCNNYGIDLALIHKFDYVAHLDDDDTFEPNHLANFNEAIQATGADFICSKANYVGGRILPTDQSNEKFAPFLPNICQVIHSSICVNFRKIPIRYVNTYEMDGSLYPADGYLMMQLRKHITENNLTSIMVNEITCNHTEEGGLKN